MKTEVTPIVAKAEIDFGIRGLARAIQSEYARQRKAQDTADLHGLEIGRLICEFGTKTEVQGKLAVINAKKNGRPQAVHCFVSEQLIVSGEFSGISQRHLERCARAFLKAQKRGLPLNTSIRVAESLDALKKIAEKPLDENQPSPERLFNTEAPADNGRDGDDFDPDKVALKIAQKVKEYSISPQGHPYLRTKKQQDDFAKKLEAAFETVGLQGWVIVPLERK